MPRPTIVKYHLRVKSDEPIPLPADYREDFEALGINYFSIPPDAPKMGSPHIFRGADISGCVYSDSSGVSIIVTIGPSSLKRQEDEVKRLLMQLPMFTQVECEPKK